MENPFSFVVFSFTLCFTERGVHDEHVEQSGTDIVDHVQIITEQTSKGKDTCWLPKNKVNCESKNMSLYDKRQVNSIK